MFLAQGQRYFLVPGCHMPDEGSKQASGTAYCLLCQSAAGLRNTRELSLLQTEVCPFPALARLAPPVMYMPSGSRRRSAESLDALLN